MSLRGFLGWITLKYILFRYYELIIYIFHVPIPSHQCSITFICVKHGLFVSFTSSIAIDKRVRLIIIALINDDLSVGEVFIHFFQNIKSYEWKYYHSINSFCFFHSVNYFLPKFVSFLIVSWTHRMTLYKSPLSSSSFPICFLSHSSFSLSLPKLAIMFCRTVFGCSGLLCLLFARAPSFLDSD